MKIRPMLSRFLAVLLVFSSVTIYTCKEGESICECQYDEDCEEGFRCDSEKCKCYRDNSCTRDEHCADLGPCMECRDFRCTSFACESDEECFLEESCRYCGEYDSDIGCRRCEYAGPCDTSACEDPDSPLYCEEGRIVCYGCQCQCRPHCGGSCPDGQYCCRVTQTCDPLPLACPGDADCPAGMQVNPNPGGTLNEETCEIEDADCRCVQVCTADSDCSANQCCLNEICEDIDCGTMECGPDPVCGESCGDCIGCQGFPDPDLCNPGGTCQQVCCPDCAGKCCGDDGCAGLCPDNCPLTGQTCNTQSCMCEGVCQPFCQDKVCGPDLCGGQCPPGCGENSACNLLGQCECLYESCWGLCCDEGEVCDNHGQCCLPQCDGKECGTDGCGGNCGECDPTSECCYDSTCQLATFCARLVDFSGGTIPVSGVTVKALYNDTGIQIDGMECVSDADGNVIFSNLPDVYTGFLVLGTPGDYVDTYQFNVDSQGRNEILWLVDYTTYQAAPLLADVTQDISKGLVFGAVRWVNAQGLDEEVGCTVVKANPESGEARYFADNCLPTPTTNQDPVDGRDNTNPVCSYFILANIDTGPVVLEAYVENVLKGSSGIVSTGDSVCVDYIYLESATNPQPVGCE